MGQVQGDSQLSWEIKVNPNNIRIIYYYVKESISRGTCVKFSMHLSIVKVKLGDSENKFWEHWKGGECPVESPFWGD